MFGDEYSTYICDTYNGEEYDRNTKHCVYASWFYEQIAKFMHQPSVHWTFRLYRYIYY